MVQRVLLVVSCSVVLLACQDSKLKSVDEESPGPSAEESIHQPIPETPVVTTPVDTTPVGGTVGCPGCTPDAVTMSRIFRANPIPAENAKPGNADWRSGSRTWARQVEMYASTDSAAANETIKVRVSTSTTTTVTAEVYRLGWYRGAGARKVWSGGPFASQTQAACAVHQTTMRVECSWSDTFSFKVDPAWVSGMYVVKVTRADKFFRFAPFVVRDDRAAEILMGMGTNTYQAYNYWGGESLYGDSSGKMPGARAWEVSYDRPYDGDDGAGQQLRYEMHLARFLEKEGYDVTYATNVDFIRYKNLLEGISAFVHGGHDEYWDPLQRSEVDRAIATGKLSLAHFGGNGAYWRTRAAPSSAGEGLRTLICYKSEAAQDPVPNDTTRYRDDPVNHPESKLFGSLYDGWQVTPFPLVVKDSSHWLFAGTGLTSGELIPGLVGYEFDKLNTSYSTPLGLSVSFESPVITAEGVPSRSHAVDRVLPSGTIVFSAGTIYWPLGLASDFFDPRVARMTMNVLERALTHRRPARTLPAVTGFTPPDSAPDPRWATSVDAYAGKAGVAGAQDGPADQATFNGPTGIAVLPTGEVAVSDTIGNRIRLIGIDSARTVTTIAGDGRPGYRDGAGAQAMFRAPAGLAARADGSILVADSDNHVIRKLEKVNGVWTVSTFVGFSRSAGNTDGPGNQAKFNRPTALALDANGNVFIADQAGCKIRKATADGSVVTTIAGGGPGFLDSNVGAVARFNNPSAITVAPSGELFVFDSGNQKLRRISAIAPYAVTTIAGSDDAVVSGYWQQNGSFGFRDGTGDKARFLAQMGLIYTPWDELMLADAGNARIRKIIAGPDAQNTHVYTLAGSGKVGSTLGPASQADIVSPAGIALMPNETFVVTDPFNHVVRVISR